MWDSNGLTGLHGVVFPEDMDLADLEKAVDRLALQADEPYASELACLETEEGE